MPTYMPIHSSLHVLAEPEDAHLRSDRTKERCSKPQPAPMRSALIWIEESLGAMTRSFSQQTAMSNAIRCRFRCRCRCRDQCREHCIAISMNPVVPGAHSKSESWSRDQRKCQFRSRDALTQLGLVLYLALSSVFF